MNKWTLLKELEVNEKKSKIWIKYICLPSTSRKEKFEWEISLYESFSGLKLLKLIYMYHNRKKGLGPTLIDCGLLLFPASKAYARVSKIRIDLKDQLEKLSVCWIVIKL